MSYVHRGQDRSSRRSRSRVPLAALAPVAPTSSTFAVPRTSLRRGRSCSGMPSVPPAVDPGRAKAEPGPRSRVVRPVGRSTLDRGPEPASTVVRVDSRRDATDSALGRAMRRSTGTDPAQARIRNHAKRREEMRGASQLKTPIRQVRVDLHPACGLGVRVPSSPQSYMQQMPNLSNARKPPFRRAYGHRASLSC